MHLKFMNGPPIIVTAKMDNKAQDYFNALRKAHFPEKINYLNAHITLFHNLPDASLKDIQEFISQFDSFFPLEAHAEEPYFLGRGVAIRVTSPNLVNIRNELAKKWSEWLIPQDLNSFRPHITIQNKVLPDQARELLGVMQSSFIPFTFQISGLSLWYYLNGPWKAIS